MAKVLGMQKNIPIGKAVTAKISKPLPVGARLVCADNAGAKELEIISVKGYKGVLNRYPSAGVGDLVVTSVKKGRPDLRNQIVLAVIIRQKKAFTRYTGAKIKFEDNAAVVVGEDGLPKGTEIKGAVAREATDRWNKIGTISSIII